MKLTPKSSSRILAPEGIHFARCIRIVDLGTQESSNPEWRASRKLNLGFELVDESAIFDEERGEENFVVYGNWNQSLGKKSKLRPLIESWTGKKIADEFELDTLLDLPCQIQITHVTNDKGTYANITNIMGPGKGKVSKSTMEPESLYLDETFDEEIFKKLPEFMQEMIEDSPEYKAIEAAAAPKVKAKPAPVAAKKAAPTKKRK